MNRDTTIVVQFGAKKLIRCPMAKTPSSMSAEMRRSRVAPKIARIGPPTTPMATPPIARAMIASVIRPPGISASCCEVCTVSP